MENQNVLEFVVFCIESIAEALSMDPEQVYHALAEQSNILTDYIVPEYEMLHTQGKAYITEDIIEVMREEGVLV